MEDIRLLIRDITDEDQLIALNKFLVSHIKSVRNVRAAEVRASFAVGDRVVFVHGAGSKRFQGRYGTITAILPKNIDVELDKYEGEWAVTRVRTSPTLLEAA